MIAKWHPRYSSTVGWLLLVPLLLSGCAGLYFRDVNVGLQPPPHHTLNAWPYDEYWTGIIFNGEKIGLTHLALRPTEDRGRRYELRSEALLAFHFLGLSKNVTLKTQDWVTDDLRLVRFTHEYDLDGHKLKLTGQVEGDQLLVERQTGGRTTHEAVPLTEPVYPTSAIPLYPTLRGLEVGRQYDYLVYDGERQQVARVSQAIEAYQESELFHGRAFRIETSLGGLQSTTWINDQGEPVLEMAWHGILISTLESEKRAKTYLALASVNKHDVLVEYSRVRTNVDLPRPRKVTALRIVLRGLPETFTMPSDQLQRCGPRDGHVQCVIQAAALAPIYPKPGSHQAVLTAYVQPSPAIQSQDPQIQGAAEHIVGETADPIPQIDRLVEWIQENVQQKPVDVFSALDVWEGRKAECQGLTWLYTAFARSLGIPTRVTNGLVYSQELEGFLYHTWAESYVGTGWLPVDPTFGQVGIDAAHIKLIDGERPADLLPLVDIVGKVGIEILSYRSSQAASE
ncbi:MAG: transglutaminase domain-containing protein [Nitrospiraceae bacterium]